MAKRDDVRLLLLEPQCRGWEHVPFNLALLRTAQLASRSRQLCFAAEAAHLSAVKKAWADKAFDGVEPQWREIAVPPRQLYGWGRLLAERTAMSGWIEQVQDLRPDAVILTSLTPNLMLLLKTLYRRGLPGVRRVIAIPHQNLEGVRYPYRWDRFWRLPLHMRTALCEFQPDWLRVMVLGQSLLQASREVLGEQRVKDWAVLDHPYLFEDQPEREHNTSAPLTFGYFGCNMDGLRHFATLSEAVRPGNDRVRFLLAGFAGPDLAKPLWVEGWGNRPLDDEEYRRRGRQFDYAVWTTSPDLYKFTASAAFLDALLYGKPLIYVGNRFIDYYVGQAGEIGYRVERVEDMKDVISRLASGHVAGGTFAANMAALKIRFSPESQARALERILYGEKPGRP